MNCQWSLESVAVHKPVALTEPMSTFIFHTGFRNTHTRSQHTLCMYFFPETRIHVHNLTHMLTTHLREVSCKRIN